MAHVSDGGRLELESDGAIVRFSRLGKPLQTVRPGDPLFVNLLDNYLESLADTGTLTNLKARWFSPGAWIDELP